MYWRTRYADRLGPNRVEWVIPLLPRWDIDLKKPTTRSIRRRRETTVEVDFAWLDRRPPSRRPLAISILDKPVPHIVRDRGGNSRCFRLDRTRGIDSLHIDRFHRCDHWQTIRFRCRSTRQAHGRPPLGRRWRSTARYASAPRIRQALTADPFFVRSSTSSPSFIGCLSRHSARRSGDRLALSAANRRLPSRSATDAVVGARFVISFSVLVSRGFSCTLSR